SIYPCLKGFLNNMASQIKTISDKSQFQELCRTFFVQGEINLKTKSGNLKLQYLGFSEGNIAFRIPYVKNLPEVVTTVTRNGDNTIYSTLRFRERNEDTFIFTPLKFQVLSESRKETRIDTDGSSVGTSVLYVNNVFTDIVIKNVISMNNKKVDQIKEMVKSDMQSSYNIINITFINESANDQRMKYVIENRNPIFIEDINKKPEKRFERTYNYYLNNIYPKDFRISSSKDLISEAVIPIMFRNMIPYGYIQVNNSFALQDKHFSELKKIAINVDNLLKKNKLFRATDDRFLVSDFSKNGIGIVSKDRKITRMFRQDSIVSLDVLLPTKQTSTICAKIKNIIFLDNGIIKVGMEIVDIDAISEVNYDEYLESVNK
ncbi:hypothetical protein ACFL20_11195, partial [Spirochaetota bacterium]